MKLQIKSLSGELTEEEKRYLRKRLLWFEERLPNSAIMTAGVKAHITKKSNQAYELVLHLIIAGEKKPIYTRVFKNTFAEAVDLGREKIERIVLREKQKKRFSFRLKFLSFSLRGKKNESI